MPASDPARREMVSISGQSSMYAALLAIAVKSIHVHLHISISSMAFLNPVKNEVTLLS